MYAIVKGRTGDVLEVEADAPTRQQRADAELDAHGLSGWLAHSGEQSGSNEEPYALLLLCSTSNSRRTVSPTARSVAPMAEGSWLWLSHTSCSSGGQQGSMLYACALTTISSNQSG